MRPSGAGDGEQDYTAHDAGYVVDDIEESEAMADTGEMTEAMDAAWSRLRRAFEFGGMVAKVESFDREQLTIRLVPKAGWTWSEAHL